MRTALAIAMGKLIAKITRGLKLGGGSAAPGYYSLKVDPNLVKKLSLDLPQTVLVTGTNGKTTTARMLSHILESQGLKVLRNKTGSNLERGLVSTLIDQSNLWGKLDKFDLAIWELDEAAFNTVALKLKPDIIIFLNVFRDQLDRYGEVDAVVLNWCQTLKKIAPKTSVLLNGDDQNLIKLKQCFKGQTKSFGAKDYKIAGESVVHQISAPAKLDFEAQDIKSRGLSKTSFSLIIPNFKFQIHLPLPGIYHIYDALAALACSYQLNLSIADAAKNLSYYTPAFGRVEKLDFGFIFLIKNPAGATQVFQTVAPQIKKGDRLLLALNDNVADGRDVSWIWDAQFEKLNNNLKVKILLSGSRAFDLAVRLKYAGFDPGQLILESDLKKALQTSIRGLKGRLFILPTYTAMLELQNILAKMRLKRYYWKEA